MITLLAVLAAIMVAVFIVKYPLVGVIGTSGGVLLTSKYVAHDITAPTVDMATLVSNHLTEIIFFSFFVTYGLGLFLTPIGWAIIGINIIAKRF